MSPLDPTVYVAARSEDRGLALGVRAGLRANGIVTVARWLDLPDLSTIDDEQARMCLEDVTEADVLVLVQSETQHRDTTGGHHVEFGAALMLDKPILLIGQPRNVFHGHALVTVVDRAVEMAALAALVWQVSGRGGSAVWDRSVRRG